MKLAAIGICSAALLLSGALSSNDARQFKAYTPDASAGTGCSHGTPFTYFARKGWLPAEERGVVVEFEGGGCCFNALTCDLPQYTRSVRRFV